MPRRPTLIDARDAIVAADRARFAGTHVDAIRAGFDRHGINDQLQVFITTDLNVPARIPQQVTITAHAQGFNRQSVHYHWEFGDGAQADGDEVTHTFESKPMSAKVTVTDGDGRSSFAEITLAGCNSLGGVHGLASVLVGLLFTRALRRRREQR
jgi:hypothetical protein